METPESSPLRHVDFDGLPGQEKYQLYNQALERLSEHELAQLNHAARMCIDFALMEMTDYEYFALNANERVKREQYLHYLHSLHSLKNFEMGDVYTKAIEYAEQKYEKLNTPNNRYIGENPTEEDIILLRGYITDLLRADYKDANADYKDANLEDAA